MQICCQFRIKIFINAAEIAPSNSDEFTEQRQDQRIKKAPVLELDQHFLIAYKVEINAQFGWDVKNKVDAILKNNIQQQLQFLSEYEHYPI